MGLMAGKRGLATNDWVGLEWLGGTNDMEKGASYWWLGGTNHREREASLYWTGGTNDRGGGLVGWGLHLVIGWEIKISREDFGLKLVISFHILNLEKDK